MKETVHLQNTLENKVIIWMGNSQPYFLTLIIYVLGKLNLQFAFAVYLCATSQIADRECGLLCYTNFIKVISWASQSSQ